MDPIPVTPIGVVVCDERNPARWDWVGAPTEARLVTDRTMIIGRITGHVDLEDLLDVVFRDFCIGK